MGSSDIGGISRLILGQSNYIDDITGFKCKTRRSVKGVGLERGLMVDYKTASEYNPQLNIKSRKDKQNVKDTRGRQKDIFNTSVKPEDL